MEDPEGDEAWSRAWRQYTGRCPACGKRINVLVRASRLTVTCPRPRCGQAIELPPSRDST